MLGCCNVVLDIYEQSLFCVLSIYIATHMGIDNQLGLIQTNIMIECLALQVKEL